MERIELELSEFSRRSGSVLVAHTATALDRGLEPAERILVGDGDRQWCATVRDISFDLTDTLYRVELDEELDAAEAAMLLDEPLRGGTDHLDLVDVLGLLREARSLASERSYVAGRRRS